MLRNLLWECSLRDVAQLVCGCSKQNIKIVVNIVGVKTADVEPRKEERKGEETPAALWYVSVQHLVFMEHVCKTTAARIELCSCSDYCVHPLHYCHTFISEWRLSVSTESSDGE